jgi:hypothetical protein
LSEVAAAAGFAFGAALFAAFFAGALFDLVRAAVAFVRAVVAFVARVFADGAALARVLFFAEVLRVVFFMAGSSK